MDTLKIWLLIIVIAVLLIVGIGYLIRKKSYQTIDELDKKKNSILKHAPYKEIRIVEAMPITGQSAEYRTELLKQWKAIEKDKYPSIETHLFDAEQATDQLRFNKARSAQQRARQTLNEVEKELEAFTKLINDFIRQEEANLKRINEIKEKYHEIRKALLARSFSFGNAAGKLEQQLAAMEDYFTSFSNFTLSGDHEEANRIIIKLNQEIETMRQQMDQIPQLFQRFDEIYLEQLKEIEQGYQYFLKNGYVFAENDIPKAVQSIRTQIANLIKEIETLNFENVARETDDIEQQIDAQYEKMDVELKAKQEVKDLIKRNKQAIFYLKDEQKKLNVMAERLAESYWLQNSEQQKTQQLLTLIGSEEKQFRMLTERLAAKKLPYSEAQFLLERIFSALEKAFEQARALRHKLESYRQREIQLKEEQATMEQSMYEMKRRIENRRLPGISAKYLELFFSATKRLERFGSVLSQPVLDLKDAQRQYEMCKEDVEELKDWSDDIIKASTLTEIISQRLMRYREEHPGVEETIQYSQTLFEKDYDYGAALQLVQEKLNQIAPEDLQNILKEYQEQ
ncbi:septation ring formation regulator EzrA [Allofustis seminis]|uniref:septation ring formation regulator EzrA n=1 Tax=Allofustis seminis TaxID=166939 RepID=UPI0003705051|nr:septation ring formation regulator EzrA [Allofustis seminis]